jgi:hypothetical protein
VADALSAAAAVILSVGGGGAIVVGLSTWLRRVWANRILETDRAKYQQDRLVDLIRDRLRLLAVLDRT